MRARALAGLTALLVGAALPARAVELAGTYAGELSCQSADGSVRGGPSLLAISDRSSGLSADIDGVRYDLRTRDGDVLFRHCGAINPQYGDRDVSGAEKVTVGANSAGVPVIRMASHSEFGFCRVTWTRIDARDPGIPACGE